MSTCVTAPGWSVSHTAAWWLPVDFMSIRHSLQGIHEWRCWCSGRYPFTPPVDDRTGRPLRPAHVESFLQMALLSTQGIFYSLVGLWVRAGLISAVALRL